jgi:ketosteroid isomerase-like protein
MNDLTRCKAALVTIMMLGMRAAIAADAGLSPAECQVWERERSFAQSAMKHDRAAFTGHVHEGAVFGAASPNTQSGRDAILKAWNPIIEGKGISLEWRPQFVSIGADLNVAMSRGPFAIKSWDDKGNTKYVIGSFVSVWVRKDETSPWLVMLDGGGPPPTPATEEEARKHLDSAPKECPRAVK